MLELGFLGLKVPLEEVPKSLSNGFGVYSVKKPKMAQLSQIEPLEEKLECDFSHIK